MRSVFAAAILALLSTGCGTVIKQTNLNPSPKPMSPRSSEEVEVFMTGRPAVPYAEVTLISAQQQELSHDGTPEIVNKMRAAAATQGCDALIITMTNDKMSGSTGGAFGGGYGSSDTLKGFHGVCAVYKN